MSVNDLVLVVQMRFAKITLETTLVLVKWDTQEILLME